MTTIAFAMILAVFMHEMQILWSSQTSQAKSVDKVNSKPINILQCYPNLYT